MADFITLSCPSCGARLQITRDLTRFACAHCGQEHLVKRHGGTLSLAPVLDRLETIGEGTSKTASELAIARLTQDVASLRAQAASTRQVNSRKSVSATWQWVALAAVTGILLLWALDALLSHKTFSTFFSLAGALTFAVLSALAILKQRRDDQARHQTLLDFDQMISAKLSEIETHKRIVDRRY